MTKPLREPPAEGPLLDGEWWYWWGTTGVDPNVTPLSCAPDPVTEGLCADGTEAGNGIDPLYKVYLQKDQYNVWQAGTADWSGAPFVVDRLDWGDNLESVDWYTKSMVRTEVVLYQDLVEPLLTYGMRHVSGWGIDEVHGLATLDGAIEAFDGSEATVFSPCGRLTIQRLVVDRGDAALDELVWVPTVGWTEAEDYEGEPIINDPLFNKPVWEAGDGPGYYNAEINVKGKIIYGYTWNVRNLNEGAGDYRITFSLDEACGTVDRNATFWDGVNETEIMLPIEEEGEVTAEADEGGDTGGGTAVMVGEQNLTYIDITILQRGGGGGGGPKR